MTIFDSPGLTFERDKRAEPRKKATTKNTFAQFAMRLDDEGQWINNSCFFREAIEHTHQSTISLLACFMRGDKDDLEEASKGSYLVCTVGNFACRLPTKLVTRLM
jgi:hypothetical protein